MAAVPEPEWITPEGTDIRCDIIRAISVESGVVLSIGSLVGEQRERVALQATIELPPATAKNLHELLGRLIRDAEAVPPSANNAPYRLRVRGGP